MDNPNYMKGDSEMPVTYVSTDEEGGVLFVEQGPAITGGAKMSFEQRMHGSGRIVNPQYLPDWPKLTSSGRVVNPEFLPGYSQGTEYLPAGQISWPPPMPMHRIGVDWEHAYHFGAVSAECVRGSRRQG